MAEERSFDVAVDAWLAELRDVLKRRPNTIRAYEGDLDLLRAHLAERSHAGVEDVSKIDVKVVEQFFSARHAIESPSSATRRRIAFRGFFDFCAKTNRVHRSISPHLELPEQPRQATRIAPAAEVAQASLQALNAVAAASVGEDADASLRRIAVGLRDRAAIELLFGAGLRISELVALSTSDIDGHFVGVAGEGKHRRVVAIEEGCFAAVRDWVANGHPFSPMRRAEMPSFWALEANASLIQSSAGESQLTGRRPGRPNDSTLRSSDTATPLDASMPERTSATSGKSLVTPASKRRSATSTSSKSLHPFETVSLETVSASPQLSVQRAREGELRRGFKPHQRRHRHHPAECGV